MALINCPECQKEISDKVVNCPHCGYPFERETNTNLNNNGKKNNAAKKPSKVKKVVIGSIVTIVSIIVIITVIGIIIYSQNEKKNNYFINLSQIHSKILSGGVIAEQLTSITRQVWNNSIHKRSDIDTNKYTIQNNIYSPNRLNYNSSDFLSDFNEALSNLSKDEDYISKKNDLRKIQDESTALMRDMKNYPQEYEYIYNDLLEYYNTFLSLTRIAINPSGSYNSFTSNVDDLITKFLEYHNKIDLLY
jgi:hypothetical protein